MAMRVGEVVAWLTENFYSDATVAIDEGGLALIGKFGRDGEQVYLEVGGEVEDDD